MWLWCIHELGNFQEKKVPHKNRRRRRKKEITLSKTRELGAAIDSEQLSEMTETEGELESGGGGSGKDHTINRLVDYSVDSYFDLISRLGPP